MARTSKRNRRRNKNKNNKQNDRDIKENNVDSRLPLPTPNSQNRHHKETSRNHQETYRNHQETELKTPVNKIHVPSPNVTKSNVRRFHSPEKLSFQTPSPPKSFPMKSVAGLIVLTCVSLYALYFALHVFVFNPQELKMRELEFESSKIALEKVRLRHEFDMEVMQSKHKSDIMEIENNQREREGKFDRDLLKMRQSHELELAKIRDELDMDYRLKQIRLSNEKEKQILTLDLQGKLAVKALDSQVEMMVLEHKNVENVGKKCDEARRQATSWFASKASADLSERVCAEFSEEKGRVGGLIEKLPQNHRNAFGGYQRKEIEN